MTEYHFHHPEKMFTDRTELLEIIGGERLRCWRWRWRPAVSDHRQLRLRCRGELLLLPLRAQGKKLEYMRANPNVWGQVVENRWGYVTGKCDHAYRSVHFAGQVDFLQDEEEKRGSADPDDPADGAGPGAVGTTPAGACRLGKTVVGRVQVLDMTGKRNAYWNCSDVWRKFDKARESDVSSM